MLSSVLLDTVIDYQEIVELTVPFGEQFDWDPVAGLSCPNCQTTQAIPENSVAYTVYATDAYSCTVNFTYNIEVRMEIPNVITPNSDGINDVFHIGSLPEGSRLRIVDRAGRLIYETANYDNRWPENAPGSIPAITNTYWYTLECPDSDPIQGYVLVKY
jgi:gliding motility-associated-like protein